MMGRSVDGAGNQDVHSRVEALSYPVLAHPARTGEHRTGPTVLQRREGLLSPRWRTRVAQCHTREYPLPRAAAHPCADRASWHVQLHQLRMRDHPLVCGDQFVDCSAVVVRSSRHTFSIRAETENCSNLPSDCGYPCGYAATPFDIDHSWVRTY